MCIVPFFVKLQILKSYIIKKAILLDKCLIPCTKTWLRIYRTFGTLPKHVCKFLEKISLLLMDYQCWGITQHQEL